MWSWPLFLFSPQIVIIEHKSIICPGYNAVLHIHTCIEEVQITVRLNMWTLCLDKKKNTGCLDKLNAPYSYLTEWEVDVCKQQIVW